MYRLKLDDDWLFNADLPDYSIEKGTLTLEANKLGTLKFTVYDTNPAYQDIRKLTSLITVYRDSEIIWLGRPIKSKLNFKGGVEYTCEDILAKLNDIKRRPSYSKTTEGLYIQELMTDYNTRAGTAPETVTDARKVRIVMGSTPHSGDDANLEFFNDDYIGYWDLMQTKVVETYGGYIKPTYSADKVTIDYVGDEDLLESGQSIQFGENLDNLFVETDGNETFSVLIPLGADVNNPSAQGEMSKNTPLTINGDSRSGGRQSSETLRRNAPHSGYVQQVRRATRRVESFRFNPNTVSVEDLIRLGFSEKQAQAIDNYRTKGGRFRRKADFAKSFVVADSVFRRLEPFIDIPRVDLNRADSAALDALPGIGPYYAAKIVGYRAELGGYSYPEQLMDLYRFDREKYDALQDLVFCSKPAPYALWTLPADSLRKHPYIRSRQAARAIVLFRENTPREEWTVQALSAAGILPEEDARRLSRCVIAEP